nr:(+)-neomenthol dehydrogenase-like isoform X1 [Coffea arabica]
MAQNLGQISNVCFSKQLSLRPTTAAKTGESSSAIFIQPPPHSSSTNISALLSLPLSSIPLSGKIETEKLTRIQRVGAMAVDDVGSPVRYAVVTGANKGIGLETVRQLATAGVTVILTARNENRGKEATSKLHQSGLSNVVFHQLDVLETESIKSLAKFIETEFGRLDILVNNAGASGVVVDEDGLRALNVDPANWLAGKAVNVVQDVIKTTYEAAKLCLDTNYYGVKNVTEALLPLVQRSTSGARIVNISSLRSELKRIPDDQRRKELGDTDSLTEEKINAILQQFLHDLKHDALEANGWQKMLPAYSISKASLNAYTRVLAKKYPDMCINCVHPGFVKTDINWNTGIMTVEEGAAGPVMLALLPQGGPTGSYFDTTKLAEF